MKIIDRDEIKSVLPGVDLLSPIEEAFAAYSEGRAVVPPVGELLLEKDEVHIKYGYIKGAGHYVIKIASGFYGNEHLGLPSGSGMMILFSQLTGEPVAVLLDEGHLTDVRTAAAGAIAAKYLAPSKVEKIGIVGTGVQARLQLKYLENATDCRDVVVWGRNGGKIKEYQTELSSLGFQISTAVDAGEILQTCDLVVTTTPSKIPLLSAAELRPGTHITAVGSDTPTKQELDPQILANADIVVADSVSQCLERGEIHHALAVEKVRREEIVELGDVISGRSPGRTSDQQVTVADLTGVAVQDVAIAESVFRAVRKTVG